MTALASSLAPASSMTTIVTSPGHQLDFGALFFEYFRNARRPLRYRVRSSSSNVVHDLEFVSSLAWAANLTLPAIVLRRARVSVRLVRLCNEVPEQDGRRELAIKSRLVIGPVSAIEWRFVGEPLPASEPTQISGLCLAPDFWDHEIAGCTIILLGDSWRCLVQLSRKDFSLTLTDEGEPAPASELFRQEGFLL